MPGTTDERPNWSLALPAPLESVVDDPVVRAVAAAMATTGPAGDLGDCCGARLFDR